ncbi:MAG: tubulin-like doman-containing protein [Acidimicrobiia bacterium]|nr:tubulin-like doman-containing protein [Acidimicrobiia bacterium]
MLRPVIFIGCGGSGEKAVRYVRDAVRRRLEHCGWTQEMPEAWQFIGLDTLTVQESPTEIPTIPVRDFLTLSAEHDSYGALYRSLIANHGGHQGRPDLLCGWLPNHDQVRIPLKDGAGQNRAIGRASGLRSLERTLLPRLKEAFERAQSGAQELYEAGQYLGVDAALGSDAPEPLVVVCTSMAGGTGAGVALDVVDLLRLCDPLGGHPSLVLFANDIFDLDNKQAMAANSLGLMSEMLAAYWSEPGEIETPLSTEGVQKPGVGPHSVFILGRSGYRGANLGSTAEVYQAVGEALSTWVTSSIVQERIHNFINVNWRNDARKNYGGYPFGREQQFGAISSFGAAKVTVGRDRFAQWAEDLLARGVLEGLHQGHLRMSPSGPSDGYDTDEELVEKLAEQYAEGVHKAVPLVGPAPEPVPGCYGASDHFAPAEEVREIASRVKRDLAFSADQTGTGAQWRDQLERLGRRQIERVEGEARAAQDGEWCQTMVDATCEAASQVAAVTSLPVAAAALTHAAVKLNPEEINRVRQDASTADRYYRQHIAAGLDLLSRTDGQIGGEDKRTQEAVEKIARGIAFRWQSLRLDAAAEVMELAGDQVLLVISDALRAALGQVANALESDDVKAWPTDSSGVSKRYMPSSVELPLEGHEAWPKMLAELCQEAVVEGVNCGSRATDPLRYRLVAGTPLVAGEDDIQPLVYRSLMRWVPGQAANLVCQAARDDIEERVRKWTRSSGGRFTRVVSEGLASYLKDSDPHTGQRRVDHAQRLETFRLQLGKAMRQSEPLVSINSDLYGECHGSPISLLTVCSQFPFPEGHPAAAPARKIVGEQAYESGSSDTASVLISQYIDSPLHPLAVRSFTNPIMEAMAANEDPGERAASFWMWRRGRRLDGFVPLPRRVLESIVRGFAVARLCGYVTADIERPVLINAASDVVEFPWPLLSQLDDPNDILAGLLEGFSLTFGMVDGRGFSAYEGYRRLYELGEPSGQGRLHEDLREVLAVGKPPCGTVANELPKAEGDSPEERQNNARRYLEENMAWFKDQETKRDNGVALRGMDGSAEAGVPTMELAGLFSTCYSQLHELLKDQGPRGSVV